MAYEVKIQIKTEADLAQLKLTVEQQQKLRKELEAYRQEAALQQQAARQVSQGQNQVAVTTGAAARQLAVAGASARFLATGLISQLNPALGAAVSQMAMLNTVAKGLGGTLATVSAVAGVGVALLAVGKLISSWRQAQQAADDLSKTLQDQYRNLAIANAEYRNITGAIDDAELAVIRFRYSHAEQIQKMTQDVEKLRTSWFRGMLELRTLSFPFSIADIFGLNTREKDEQKINKSLQNFESEAGAIRKRMEESARRRAASQSESQRNSFAEGLKKSNEQLTLQIIALTAGEEAMESWNLKNLEAEAASLKLTEAQRREVAEHIQLTRTIRILREQKAEETREIERQAAAIQVSKELGARLDQEEAEAKALNRQAIEAAIKTKEREMELDVERLRLAGLHDAAAKKELENFIAIQEERKKRIGEAANSGEIFRTPGEIQQAQHNIDITRLKIQSLGDQVQAVTVDIGRAISDMLVDTAHGLATGTLRGFDAVKAAGAGMLRLVTDLFRQTLAQKLSFETQILSNVRGLPQQMNAAMAAGVGTGSGSGLGSVGLFDWLFNMRPPGMEGPMLPGGGFFSGAPGLGGILTSGMGGLMIGQLMGGGIGTNIGSTLGGIGGHLLGATSFGAGITGAIGSALGGGALGGLIGNAVLPGLGAILGGLLGSIFGGLFKSKPPRMMFGLRRPEAGGIMFRRGDPEDIPVQQLFDEGPDLLRFRDSTVNRKTQDALRQALTDLLDPYQKALGMLSGEERESVLGAGVTEFAVESRNPKQFERLAREAMERVQEQLTAAYAEAIGVGFESSEQLGDFLDVREPIRRNIEELELQLSILGKTTEEAMRLRREFELAQLAQADFSQEQLDHLAAQAEERDRLAVELQRQQTVQGYGSQIDELRLAMELIGKSTEEQLRLRREFELSRLPFEDIDGSVREKAEERDRAAFELHREQQFGGVQDALQREIDEARFRIMTQGMTPQEQEEARREFELKRLVDLTEEQLDVLREMMKDRDELRRMIEEMRRPNIEINLENQDPEEIARAIADLLSGRTAPSV